MMLLVVVAAVAAAALGAEVDASNQWQPRPAAGPSPLARRGHSAVARDEGFRMVAFGGMLDDATYFNDVWVFEAYALEWYRIHDGVASDAPAARTGHAAVLDATEQRMFVVGGRHEAEFFDDLWVLDLSTATWTLLDDAAPVQGRAGHSFTHIDGVLYVIGGAAGAVMGDVWTYTIETGEWAELETTGLPFPARAAHSAVAYNTDIVVFGGFDAEFRPLDDVWALSTTTGEWRRMDPANARPGPRHSHACTRVGALMLVSGGQSNEGLGALFLEPSSWTFNLESFRWEPLRGLGTPSARSHHTATTIGDSVFVFGGQTDPIVVSDVFQLDVFSGNWARLLFSGEKLSGRVGAVSVYLPGNGLVVHGGLLESGAYSDETWLYDPESVQWMPIAEAGAPSARGYHAGALYGNRIYLVGGRDETRTLSDVWVLLIDRTWAEIVPTGTFAARYDHTAVLIGSSLVVSGGRDGEHNTLDAIDALDLDRIDPAAANPDDLSMSFDGINDYVSISQTGPLLLGDSFTIEFWILVNTFNRNYQRIMSKGQDGLLIRRCFSTDLLCFDTFGPSNWQLRSSTSINDGRWHHIAVVYDGPGDGTKYIYIDGAEDATVGATGNMTETGDPFVLGTDSGRESFFSGQLDDVRLWSVPRSAAEIRGNMFSSISAPTPGLTAAWTFDSVDKVRGVTPNVVSPGTYDGQLGAGVGVSFPKSTASSTPAALSCSSVDECDIPRLFDWEPLSFAVVGQDDEPIRSRAGHVSAVFEEHSLISVGGYTSVLPADGEEPPAGEPLPSSPLFDVIEYNMAAGTVEVLFAETAETASAAYQDHAAVLHDKYRLLVLGANERSPLLSEFHMLYRTMTPEEIPAELPPLFRPSAAGGPDSAYFFGGESASRFVKHRDLVSFSYESSNWANVRATGIMPSARYWPRLVQVSQTKVLLWAGWDTTGPVNDMWELDLPSDQWAPREQGDLVPPGRDGHGVVLYQDHLVIFGGEGQVAFFNDVWKFSVADSSWTEIAASNPPSPRTHVTTVLYGDMLVLFGGVPDCLTCTPSDELWVLDFVLEEWSLVATTGDIPGRFGHTAVLHDEMMVVFSGQFAPPESVRANDVWTIDVSRITNTTAGLPEWTMLTPVGAPPNGRRESSANLIGDRMIVFGGHEAGQPPFFGGNLADIWVLDLVRNEWIEPNVLGDVPLFRANHGTLVVDSTFYIIGGSFHLPYYGYRGDMWSFDFDKAYPPLCTASGTGLVSGVSGVMATFTISARNIFGESKTSGGEEFPVEIIGANRLLGSVVDNGDGSYDVNYVPQAAGVYTINIRSGSSYIQGSPFRVVIEPGPTSAATTVASGDGLTTARVGETSRFSIQARDEFFNGRPGGDAFSVRLTGPSTITGIVSDVGDGVYEVEYQPRVPGTYDLAVVFRGSHISSSPYSIYVEPGAPLVTNYFASGPGLNASLTGQSARFVIQSRDIFGNNRTSGGDDIQVTITATSDEDPPAVRVLDNEDGTYTVSYYAFTPGTYVVGVKVNGQDLPGSPFSPEVSSVFDFADNDTKLVLVVVVPVVSFAAGVFGFCASSVFGGVVARLFGKGK